MAVVFLLSLVGTCLQIFLVFQGVVDSTSWVQREKAEHGLVYGDIRLSRNQLLELRRDSLFRGGRTRRSAVGIDQHTWLSPGSDNEIPMTVHRPGRGLVRALPDMRTLAEKWPREPLQDLVTSITGKTLPLNDVHDSTFRLSYAFNNIPGHEIRGTPLPHIKDRRGLAYIIDQFAMFNNYLPESYRPHDFGEKRIQDLEPQYQGISFVGVLGDTFYQFFDLWDGQGMMFHGKIDSNATVTYVSLLVTDAPQLEQMFLRFGLESVHEAVRLIENKSCVKFRAATIDDPHIVAVKKSARFNFCWSDIGRVGGRRVQFLSLGERCLTHAHASHELMHTLGFWHEQNRPDRDQYIDVLWKNLPQSPGVRMQFRRMNNLRTQQVPYDYESILHYSQTLFSKNGQATIRTHDPGYQDSIGTRELSHKDICKINKLYKCAEKLEQLNCDCLDSDSRCGSWGAPGGRCLMAEHFDEMKLKCPRSCNLCCATRGERPCGVFYQIKGCFVLDPTVAHKIELNNEEERGKSLACSCAEVVDNKDLKLFGIQQGNCWAFFGRTPVSRSSECKDERGETCQEDSDQCCSGASENSVFLYHILP